MEKILTISIAAYNAEKDISNCLNSLINSKEFSKLDIIVVNDGSTDQTVELQINMLRNINNLFDSLIKKMADMDQQLTLV